jgi:hypothetical protein
LRDAEYRIEDLPADLRYRIVVSPATGCWEWQHKSGPDPGRYGYVLRDGCYEGVHRVVYKLLAGPIPEDRPHIDHVYTAGCRSKACCWPAHLEPVTKTENIRRGLMANPVKGVAASVRKRIAAGTATEQDLLLVPFLDEKPPERFRQPAAS